MNSVTFKRKWGQDELPVVNQHTGLDVEISRKTSLDMHTNKENVIGKGKAHSGNTDEILTDPNLDTKINDIV